MNRRSAAAAAVAAGVLAIAGCAPASAPSTLADPFARFRAQRLSWTRCGGLECARVTVPLDHDDPSGRTLSLAVQRRPATAEPRLGTLVVNPGGPAVSGRGLLGALAAAGLAGYDLVAWDTRGTGESSAVDCLSDAELEEYLALDASPDSPAEAEASRAGERAVADACADAAGDLLAHVGSDATARDLDVLRSVLGEGQLNYIGWSYGTLPGTLYAERYPDRVGRMVLDSPVDVAGDGPPLLLAADRALGRFATWCAGSRCPLGDEPDTVTAAVRRLLDSLDARPLRVGRRSLGQAEGAYGVLAHLAQGRPAWEALGDAVRSGLAGDGRALLAAVDAQNGRRPDGSYDATLTARLATVCADQPRRDADVAEEDRVRERRAAPVFSRYLTGDAGCDAWPVAAPVRTPAPAATIPILVVGGVGDPVTAHEYAVRLGETLPGGVLLTWTGDGHGVFPARSACVDLAVVDWLTAGETPADGATCP